MVIPAHEGGLGTMIALLGGTFNPVHNGHIALARQVARHYLLSDVSLVPGHLPVHREEPEVSAELRCQMIELAIAPYHELSLNRIEVARRGLSYTVDTLASLKQREPDMPICWLLGSDAFNNFASWHRPTDILDLANLIVCTRPEYPVDKTLYAEYHLSPEESLLDHQAGKIAFFPMRPNHCAASSIRRNLRSAKSVSECLSQPVIDFIKHHQLYES